MKRLWLLVGLGVFYLHADRIWPHGGIGAEVITGAIALVTLQALWLLRE